MREWLKEKRIAASLTMREVSMQSNISLCYYSQIENGKRNVSVTVAKAIAGVLDFDWDKFFD